MFNLNTAFGGLGGADDERSISGLGQLATNKTLPATCWSKPGFKDCHAVAYREAQLKCGYCAENPSDPMCAGFTTMADCQERETNAMTWDNCVSSFCPTQSPTPMNLNFTEYKAGDPCNSANTIKNVQFVSGVKTDGIWGALSQSAYDTLVRVQGTTYCDLAPGCKGNTPMGTSCGGGPAPVTTTPPPPSPEPEPEPEPDLVGTQQASMGGLMVAGLAVLLAAGTIAYLAQGKKKRR